MQDNHYRILGLAVGASAAEISAAYRQALQRLIERRGEVDAPGPELFDALRYAYRTLIDPQARRDYDSGLAGAAPAPHPVQPAGGNSDKAQDGDRYHLVFAGDGAEYFRIWIVNLLLSVLTLGVYSAWAKVRREQYFHRNLLLDGSGFDYHGQPSAILKGRLLAFALLFALSVAEKLSPTVYGFTVLALLPVAPWLVVRAFRFRAHNTSYRGLRFTFHGTYRQALTVFIGYGLLSVVSLGLGFPLWYRQQKKFVIDNLRYGRANFACDLGIWPVYRDFLIPFVVAAAAIAVVVFIVAAGFSGPASPQARMAVVGLVAMAAVAFVLAQLLVVPYIRVRTTNLVWSATRLDRHRLASRLPLPGYLGVVVGNWLLTLVTLGLFWPWAKVRMAAYRAAHTHFLAAGPLDAFVTGETRNAAAIGDEVAELFDLDVAL